MNRLVVDSSVLVSFFGKPDIFTQTSIKFLRELPKNTEIILPVLVVAETFVSTAKQSLPTKRIYEKLLKFTIVPIDTSFLEEFKKFLSRPFARTSDLIIAVTANLYAATLISWDKRHLSKDNDICETLTPKQFLNNLNVN